MSTEEKKKAAENAEALSEQEMSQVTGGIGIPASSSVFQASSRVFAPGGPGWQAGGDTGGDTGGIEIQAGGVIPKQNKAIM